MLFCTAIGNALLYWGIDVESRSIQTHQTYRWAETSMVSNHYNVSFVFCWRWPSMSLWSMIQMSTNMPSIGSVVLRITPEMFRKYLLFQFLHTTIDSMADEYQWFGDTLYHSICTSSCCAFKSLDTYAKFIHEKFVSAQYLWAKDNQKYMQALNVYGIITVLGNVYGIITMQVQEATLQFDYEISHNYIGKMF